MTGNTLILELELVFTDPIPFEDREDILRNIRNIIDQFGKGEGMISPEESEYGCEDFTVRLVAAR